MKTEINLRTREFVISREFYWPRLVATLAVILLLSAAVVGSVLVYLHLDNLRHDITFLSGREVELKQKAAPVIELEQAINRFKESAKLKEGLLEMVTPWPAYLKKIERIAGEGIRITKIAASAEGKITIIGQGITLKEVASYIQRLKTLDFLDQVSIGYINLENEERFGFALNAVSSIGGGGDRRE